MYKQMNIRFRKRISDLKNKTLLINKNQSIALGILFFVAFFTVRPSRLGLDYSLPGTILLLLIAILASKLAPLERAAKNGFYILGAVILFWFYLCGFSLFNGVQNDYPLKAMFLLIGATLAAVLLFSNKLSMDAFYKSVLMWMALSGFSALITFSLLFAGLKVETLTYLRVPVSDPYYNSPDFGNIMFPFTMSYGMVLWEGVAIPRNTFGFRESGIAQAFAAWGLCSLVFYSKKVPLWIPIGLLLAVVLSISTTFVLSLGIIGIVYLAFKKMSLKIRIAALCLFLVSGPIVVNWWIHDESFGYAAKQGTISETDRTISIDKANEEFKQNPMGKGIYNNTSGGINLLSSGSALGAPGLMLFAALVAYCHVLRRRVGGGLLPMLPILGTALTTQPLFDAGQVYIIMLLIYKSDSRVNIDKVISKIKPKRSLIPRFYIGNKWRYRR